MTKELSLSIQCRIPISDDITIGRTEEVPPTDESVPRLTCRLWQLEAAVVGTSVGHHAVRVVDACRILDRSSHHLVQILFEDRAQSADGELATTIRMHSEAQLVWKQVLGQPGLRITAVYCKSSQDLVSRGVEKTEQGSCPVFRIPRHELQVGVPPRELSVLGIQAGSEPPMRTASFVQLALRGCAIGYKPPPHPCAIQRKHERLGFGRTRVQQRRHLLTAGGSPLVCDEVRFSRSESSTGISDREVCDREFVNQHAALWVESGTHQCGTVVLVSVRSSCTGRVTSNLLQCDLGQCENAFIHTDLFSQLLTPTILSQRVEA